MEEKGFKKGFEKGFEKGLKKGMKKGKAQMAQLIAKLFDLRKIEDVEKVSKDPEYREKLLKDYGLAEDWAAFTLPCSFMSNDLVFGTAIFSGAHIWQINATRQARSFSDMLFPDTCQSSFKVKGKNELHQRNKGLHFITAQFVKSEHR